MWNQHKFRNVTIEGTHLEKKTLRSQGGPIITSTKNQSLSGFSLPMSTKFVHLEEFFAGIGNNSGQLNCEFVEFQMNLIIFGHSNLLELPPKCPTVPPPNFGLSSARDSIDPLKIWPQKQPPSCDPPNPNHSIEQVTFHQFPSGILLWKPTNFFAKTNLLWFLKAPVLHSDVRRCFGASSIVSVHWSSVKVLVQSSMSMRITAMTSFLETVFGGVGVNMLIWMVFCVLPVKAVARFLWIWRRLGKNPWIAQQIQWAPVQENDAWWFCRGG